jgi:DNA-dependent RNA polymerase auxiliary subunit epsilon
MKTKTNKKFPNIWKRIYASGNIKYCVRIQTKNNPRLHVTFDTEEDARKWLNENYYEYVKNPHEFKEIHRKKW